jgi:hypothetical protein
VRAAFYYFTLIEYKDAVSHPDGGKPMADQNSSTAFPQLAKSLKNLVFGLYIQ